MGFILTGDPKKDDKEIPHTIAFRWKSGVFNQGKAKFSSNACCIIDVPEYGVVKVSGPGFYSVETRNGVTTGNIFNDSQPKPKEPRYGDIRTVSVIGGKAYAAGLGGMVYRLDTVNSWTRIDEDLSRNFDIEGIHGFGASDIYAVGYNGELWHFNGRRWNEIELPTNVILVSVKCKNDGVVYIGGKKGILIRGQKQSWEIINHDKISDTIWDLECLKDEVYISTMSNVYLLKKDQLEPVDFGGDPPKTTGQLSAAEDVMWSIGSKDIMAYDGKTWNRIV